MFSGDLRVAVLVGSVRAGRFGGRVGEWVIKHLAGASVDADLIDLADLSFPRDMGSSPDVREFAERIGRADAVIVVTPEYNHGYPGPLKTAVDALRTEWRAKPIAFVSYGGVSGGLRAVEALRLVFAELHAMTVRETVSLHSPWGRASEAGFPGAEPEEALTRLLRVLLWWAGALRDARARTPYPV